MLFSHLRCSSLSVSVASRRVVLCARTKNDKECWSSPGKSVVGTDEPLNDPMLASLRPRSRHGDGCTPLKLSLQLFLVLTIPLHCPVAGNTREVEPSKC